MEALDLMATVRVTYDSIADAAYIYLRTIEPGGARLSVPVPADPDLPMIVLNFDEGRRLIGIEILGAVNGLPPSLLAEAERPSGGGQITR